MKILAAALLLLLPAQSFARSSFEKQRAPNGGEFYQPTPNEMIEDFSIPWDGPLNDLRAGLKENSSYVFWLMILPESPMDLRSPELFRRFIVANTPFNGGISHNLVAWNCAGVSAGGARIEGATGMSGESSGQSTQMIKDGFGLSTFFATFTDGYLEHTQSVQTAIQDIGRKHGIAGMGVEVTAQECRQMVSFAKKFARHPNKPYSRFGLTPNPDKMEGGGCVTFAMSLLKSAGVFTKVIPNFYRNLSAPRELLGGNMPLPATAELPGFPWLEGRSHSVHMNRLLSTAWIPMDYEVNLRVMDPELMLYSLKTIKDVYVSQFGPAESAAEAKRLARTTVGARLVRSAAGDGNSAGSAKFFRVDDSFDPQMAKVRALTNSWALDQLRQGKTITNSSITGYPVFLIQN